jgi:hypothetical protein
VVCEAFSMQVPLPLLMLVLVEAVEVVLEQEAQLEEVKNLLRVLLRSTTRWTSFSGSCSSAVPSSLALPVRGREEEESQRFSVVCAKQSLRAAAVRATGTDSSGTTSCCCSSPPCCQSSPGRCSTAAGLGPGG